ncbi:MAG: hypothetical protein PHS14_00300 [Elusimicrobia bacterium]|nr:hypothetical protein [Elusimicrobiota bacterium]
MAKTLDEILKAGRMDPAALRTMQDEAKKAGLTKRVIHIELDLLTGNLKSQATPMDHVMHLGMLEFYKATVLAGMLNRPIAKSDPEPEQPAPAPEAAAPAADAPAAPQPDRPGQGASDPEAPKDTPAA